MSFHTQDSLKMRDLAYIALVLSMWVGLFLILKSSKSLVDRINSSEETVYYCTKCGKPASRFISYTKNTAYTKNYSDNTAVPYCDTCTPNEKVSANSIGKSNKYDLNNMHFIFVLILLFGGVIFPRFCGHSV